MYIFKQLKQRIINKKLENQNLIDNKNLSPEMNVALQTRYNNNINYQDQLINEKLIKDNNFDMKIEKNSKCVKEHLKCKFINKCVCTNCTILSELNECGICLETLQGKEINSCSICANVICKICTVKLNICPFCRSPLILLRNRVLERFFEKFLLPCKNARLGCHALLDSTTRLVHEPICNFTEMQCPVGRGTCQWKGTVFQVLAHLKSRHNLQALNDHGVSVEIHNFRNKAKAADGRVYTVCLHYYDQLFVIRMILYEGKLRLCLRQLGCLSNTPPEERRNKFIICLNIRPFNGKFLQGFVSFEKYDRDVHEISFNCDEIYENKQLNDTFLKNNEKINNVNDLVKVDLLVKQILT